MLQLRQINATTMELSSEQQEILDIDGHLLVKGGPGSGKTTISILKASQIALSKLTPGQKILFLSFARATVARVTQAIDAESSISKEAKARIEVETYHSFFWRILKTHGYLLGLPIPVKLLSPSNEAIALAGVRADFPSRGISEEQKKEKSKKEELERRRLAFDEGLVCFSLFAEFVADLIGRSDKVRRLISDKFPFIILDEFQDTDQNQWRVMKVLGVGSCILALADPEQRIFEWIGADPERLDHFESEFSPTLIDLGSANHRSGGTDLATFGDHILTGKFQDDPYAGLYFETYPSNKNQALTKVITTALQARTRLLRDGAKDWSIAILVPTKAMTRIVSDKLRHPPAGLSAVSHSAAVEMEAVVLAAELIAFSLEVSGGSSETASFLSMIEEFYLGRGGDSPTKKDLKSAGKIRSDFAAFTKAISQQKKPRKTNSIPSILAAFELLSSLDLSGNPEVDWLEVRKVLEGCGSPQLVEIADEAKNVRLLERGSELRQALAQLWRDGGSYAGALEVVRGAFVQEHFSSSNRPEQGVVVMNMHKAKGKQFDEVIIFDGWERFRNRIVRQNKAENVSGQVRQNFRVSVTRAKTRTTILTPQNDACVLLVAD